MALQLGLAINTCNDGNVNAIASAAFALFFRTWKKGAGAFERKSSRVYRADGSLCQQVAVAQLTHVT